MSTLHELIKYGSFLFGAGRVPEAIEFTLVGEGTIPKGSDGSVAIDTGVTWADIKDYDWFDISVGAANGWGTTGPYYFNNLPNPPAAYQRTVLTSGAIGKSRFKKVAYGIYEHFMGANQVANSGVTLQADATNNDYWALSGPESALINLGLWADTDKFYIYPGSACVVDMTFRISGMKFK